MVHSGPVNPIDTWERMVRFHRVSTEHMDESLRQAFGRGLDDYDVLHQVRTNDKPIRMSDLAGRLLIANSSCNRIVNRLVEDGLLQRATGPVDRREVLIEMTDDGSELWVEMARHHARDIVRAVATPLTREQMQGLDDAMQALAVSPPPSG